MLVQRGLVPTTEVVGRMAKEGVVATVAIEVVDLEEEDSDDTRSLLIRFQLTHNIYSLLRIIIAQA